MKDNIENLEGIVSKLKEQGINAGEFEKERIIATAKKQAEEIVNQARAESDKLMKDTEAKLKLLEQNSTAALKQASRDFIEGTKIAILKHLKSVFGHQTAELFTQEQYLKELLKVILERISGNKSISVSPEMKEKMENYILNSAFKEKLELKPLPQSSAKIVIDSSDSEKIQLVLSSEDVKEGLFSLINSELIEMITNEKEDS